MIDVEHQLRPAVHPALQARAEPLLDLRVEHQVQLFLVRLVHVHPAMLLQLRFRDLVDQLLDVNGTDHQLAVNSVVADARDDHLIVVLLVQGWRRDRAQNRVHQRLVQVHIVVGRRVVENHLDGRLLALLPARLVHHHLGNQAFEHQRIEERLLGDARIILKVLETEQRQLEGLRRNRQELRLADVNVVEGDPLEVPVVDADAVRLPFVHLHDLDAMVTLGDGRQVNVVELDLHRALLAGNHLDLNLV